MDEATLLMDVLSVSYHINRLPLVERIYLLEKKIANFFRRKLQNPINLVNRHYQEEWDFLWKKMPNHLSEEMSVPKSKFSLK